MVNGEVAQRDELSKPGDRIHPIESKSRGGDAAGLFLWTPIIRMPLHKDLEPIRIGHQ